MDEIDKVITKLEEIEKTFGKGGVWAAIILFTFLIFIWIYAKTSIQKAAEKSSDESLKKIQSHLEKELVKFSTKHQKQIDAVHECYLKLERLTNMINYLNNGEKFTQQSEPKRDLPYLITYRHEFKQTYGESRLLFSKKLCDQIDKLIPTVDKFIETYEGGLWDWDQEEVEMNSTENNGGYIAGLWSHGA